MDAQDAQYEENLKEQKSGKTIKKTYSTKELAEMKTRIMEDIEAMRQYKASGCYYDPETNDVNVRLQKDDEQYLMSTANDETGWSNTKSTALHKNIKAIVGEYNDLENIIRVKPGSEKDFDKKVVLEKVIASKRADPQFKEVDGRIFEEMVRYGWAVKHIMKNKIVRKVRVAKKAKDMTDEEKLAVKQDQEIPYIWKMMTDYNDIDEENINPEDFFPEPGAYRINSRFKPMNKCAVIDYVSFDVFKQLTENDPVVLKKQAAKVERGDQEDTGTDFNRTVKSGGGNQVQRIRYYNKINDEFVTLYNEEIVRPGLLPFHELPFVDYHFCGFKDHFFTPGLGAFLQGLMGDEEDIKNTFKDVLKVIMNPPTYVDAMVFNEFLQIGDKLMPGEIIPISGLASNPNLIREQEVKNVRLGEVMSALGTIDEDQIQVAGINPRRFGSLQRSSNATEVATVDASSAKILRLMLNSFYTGEIWSANLLFKWMNHEYTKDILFDKYGEKLEKPKKRKLVLEGAELVYPKTDKEKLKEKRIEGFSVFDLEADYFRFDELPSFYIDPEADAQLNRAANSQKWQALLPQMATFAGDPLYTPPGQPVPPFNVNKMAFYYARANDIPEDILNSAVEDPEADRDEALKENQQIFDGDIIVGQMGRGRYHLEAHLQAILLIERYLAELRNRVEEEINPMMKQLGAQLGLPSMPESPEERAIKDMEYRLEYLRWHTEIDRLPIGGILPPEPQSVKGGSSSAAQMPQGVNMGTPALPPGGMPGMMPTGNVMQMG